MSTAQAPPDELPDDTGVFCELGVAGQPLVIAYGGIAGRTSAPMFEFFRVTDGMPVQRLMLRDHERSWYHRGVRGVGDDLPAVEAYVASILEEAKPSRVVMVGASAGGFAAMLFGHRLGADVVHAFAPQTFVDPSLRRTRREPRWEPETRALLHSGRYDPRFGDLAAVLATPPAKATTRHHVWYCTSEQPDAVHAAHVAQVPAVQLHALPAGGHVIVKWLRDTGHLTPIVRASLEGGVVPRLPEEVDPVLLARPSRVWLARRRWWIIKQAVRDRRHGVQAGPRIA
ncbi:MAG: alpha/beta fold hydrolase [Baekduiaceae bacterium]